MIPRFWFAFNWFAAATVRSFFRILWCSSCAGSAVSPGKCAKSPVDWVAFGYAAVDALVGLPLFQDPTVAPAVDVFDPYVVHVSSSGA